MFSVELDTVEFNDQDFQAFLSHSGIESRKVGSINGNDIYRYSAKNRATLQQLIHDCWGDDSLSEAIYFTHNGRYRE